MEPTFDRIQAAVAAIYPEIEKAAMASPAQLCEEELWHELACCILSSQVPYPLAQAAADRIRGHRVLVPLHEFEPGGCERALQSLLRGTFFVEGRERRYRFPNSKARQISGTRLNVLQSFGTLTAALLEFDNAETARKWFVKNAPGLGPKQASMFLRNCRGAYDLAIIDRHVLTYMHIAGLRPSGTLVPARYAGYLEYELILRSHSHAKGYMLGLFDYAVWIVMRVVARQKVVEGHRT
ncbi:MAG: N-glycosylase/DNA lyase family protein [Xanthobacteraceae bacterium]|nr:N-glycosylase/DNA lyase family protein [Xanthobacteraceae bacterium]